MDDRNDPVTRLGPDSGGRARGDTPGSGPGGRPPSGPDIHAYSWQWGPDDARRPGLPWIGIFLLVFGGLLLVQAVFPQFQAVGSVFVLAIGLAFLIRWAVDRRTGSLYAGAIITALSVPGLLSAAGVKADGLSTFSLGAAFLFIAAVRAVSGGGWGWQLWLGGMLAILGGVHIANPAVGGLLVPVALVALGAALVLRGSTRGR